MSEVRNLSRAVSRCPSYHPFSSLVERSTWRTQFLKDCGLKGHMKDKEQRLGFDVRALGQTMSVFQASSNKLVT